MSFEKEKMEKNLKDIFVCGTRPDIIKFAPLILKMKPVVIHTGQHKELADEAFKIFDIKPDYDLKLMQENQSVLDFIQRGIISLDSLFKSIQPNRVWVLGDTATAYVGALVAYLNKNTLIHVESGLRSFDFNNPYPEEMFRVIIDKMSDILFAPTYLNVRNLEKEKVKGEIHEVGNLIVDALNMIKEKISKTRPIEEPYVLLTMHRRESFGKEMRNVFEVVKKLSKKIKIVFPAHLNPNVRRIAREVGLSIIEPLNYLDFLWHLKYCEFVMSDSGGVQEEVPSFDKPILILRKVTERQEILKTGYAFLSSLDKKDLYEKIDKILSFTKVHYNQNPFGDGKTSNRIQKIICSEKK